MRICTNQKKAVPLSAILADCAYSVYILINHFT